MGEWKRITSDCHPPMGGEWSPWWGYGPQCGVVLEQDFPWYGFACDCEHGTADGPGIDSQSLFTHWMPAELPEPPK